MSQIKRKRCVEKHNYKKANVLEVLHPQITLVKPVLALTYLEAHLNCMSTDSKSWKCNKFF
jgi:hypothetical protein